MKVILTGSTGMIGKAVLIECLESNNVENVLVINRSTLNIKHPKLTEIIHADFLNFDSIKNSFSGYDACFNCLGISAVGLKEEEYTNITYEMTRALAKTIYSLNPKMVFIFVSGAGTDSSENGRIMWARVKGKTENMIFNLGFKDAYAFRPGFILPDKGVKSRTKLYNAIYSIFRPFNPLLKRMNSVTLSSRVGVAMINTILHPQDKKIIYNQDINQIAKQE